ncbi:MAG TPA: response regulator transcription factor [Rhizomicrobium sp.]|jgi:DNA-binding CsgD family transcriptional regulator|nr:response regulator transcription factor [Rhizomicrobium sp.]
MWKTIAVYGAALAAGALVLQWLDYDRLAWSRPGEIYFALIAAAFLGLGIFIGMRVFAGPAPAPFDGNPQAVASLGISPRELLVLKELAAGRSNKEIARLLEISPNTVKTHLARVYEKLGAERRTDAVNRARELGIIA